MELKTLKTLRESYMNSEIEGSGPQTTAQERLCIGFGWDMCLAEIKDKLSKSLTKKEYKLILKVLE